MKTNIFYIFFLLFFAATTTVNAQETITTPIKTLTGHGSKINSVCFPSDGRYLISGSSDGTAKLWNVLTGICGRTFKNEGLTFISHISPDGKNVLLAGSENTILWNIQSITYSEKYPFDDGTTFSVQFSPSGKYFIFAGEYGKICLCRTEPRWYQKKLIKSFNRYCPIYSVCFSPDKKYIISGGEICENNKSMELWNIESGICEKIFSEHESTVWSVHFSSSGKYVASGSEDGTVRIWDVALGICEKILKTKRYGVKAVSFSLDEKYVAFSYSNNLQIWDIDSNLCRRTLCNENTIYCLSFSPNGKQIVTGDDAGNIKLWDISSLNINSRGFREETTELQNVGKYYALLIGVSDYTDSRIPDLDGLPVKDAKRLEKILNDNYTFAEILVLTNPTSQQIIRALDDLKKKVTPSDNVLIFYAGHGDYDAKNNLGYWLPVNADIGYTDAWIYNSLLTDKLKEIDSKHTLVISDACFSGSIFKKRDLPKEATQTHRQKYESKSRRAITSGTLKTVPNNSIFFKYLSEKLEKNTQKCLSASELFQQIEQIVGNNSPTLPQYGIIQNIGDEMGDFIFIRK